MQKQIINFHHHTTMTTAADKIFVLKVERARRHAKVMASTSYYANKSLSWLKIGQIKKKKEERERGEKHHHSISQCMHSRSLCGTDTHTQLKREKPTQ